MSRLDSVPFADKTLTATLYMQTPSTHLTAVLMQRAGYARRPGICPRCGAYLMGHNHIVEKGYSGLWCRECDEE